MYFVNIKGKRQLVSFGPEAALIHLKYFKTHIKKVSKIEEAEKYGKQLIWSTIKAANRKCPSFEKWKEEIGELGADEAADIINTIVDEFNKRKRKVR